MTLKKIIKHLCFKGDLNIPTGLEESEKLSNKFFYYTY